MKKFKLTLVLVILVAGFSSCEYGREAERQLHEINNQAEDIDAMVNEGIESVTNLDSILPETNKKLKKADSIIGDAAATLDSLNSRVEAIENIFN